MIQIEDEITFLMENMEYYVEPDQAIKNYFKVRKYMFYILLMNLVFECMMTAYLVSNEQKIIEKLNRIYHVWNVKDF